jgi:hypothetical protein
MLLIAIETTEFTEDTEVHGRGPKADRLPSCPSRSSWFHWLEIILFKRFVNAEAAED